MERKTTEISQMECFVGLALKKKTKPRHIAIHMIKNWGKNTSSYEDKKVLFAFLYHFNFHESILTLASQWLSSNKKVPWSFVFDVLEKQKIRVSEEEERILKKSFSEMLSGKAPYLCSWKPLSSLFEGMWKKDMTEKKQPLKKTMVFKPK